MADINLLDRVTDAEALELVELLFFAYRDFVSDADHMLAEMDFGRAHHRVLHFVGRNPGMTVAQLLDILQITKQSLSRVLKELIEKGFIFQKEGEDRRQRLLHLTNTGEELWQRLVAPQKRRFQHVLQDNTARDQMQNMLLQLINAENRKAVRTWQSRAKG
jgi:DNA-binding MarR family transcriptional regulator